MMATKCEHLIASGELEGNPFWYCPMCLGRLQGEQAEFPDKTLGEIMVEFMAALPVVEQGGPLQKLYLRLAGQGTDSA